MGLIRDQDKILQILNESDNDDDDSPFFGPSGVPSGSEPDDNLEEDLVEDTDEIEDDSIMRDNLLSAYRLSKGLTTDRIGLSGTSCRIYLNEHLTLRNKDLFRKCREAAKLKKFKFVWVRNATVLVKESEDSSTFAVRTEDEISSKIKSNFHPSDPNIVN
ncbi:hypothetical protein PYW08_012948 [Mythimna loreyi]|uniref:Uncharacterized protein n=1 Tax=Mythimna loreyi TaxID=667449 RepID=A0ACC2PZ59_9NEOP|nr:hypothetical protein PYW08_012948 [Mythimna loreyi]